MLKRTIHRRILGTTLILFGALLLWLAPEIWSGVVMILIAIALEILGITLERKSGKNQT